MCSCMTVGMPASIVWLHRLADERKDDFEYKFSASVLEIYNEQIYDLLAGGRDQDADKLDVKQVGQGAGWIY